MAKQTSSYKQALYNNALPDKGKEMKYRILVVDDEADICLLLSSILKRLGHEVICSHTLAEGKSDFLSFGPDLMFMDINLPDGNGLEEVSSFQDLNHDVRIIMISAYDFPQEIKKTEQLNLTLLRKPFNREKIIQAIQPLN